MMKLSKTTKRFGLEFGNGISQSLLCVSFNNAEVNTVHDEIV